MERREGGPGPLHLTRCLIELASMALVELVQFVDDGIVELMDE